MDDVTRLRSERDHLLSALVNVKAHASLAGLVVLDSGVENALAEFQQLKARLHQQQREARDAEFRKAWARMEAAGYRYGSDALEQVRMGWRLARGEL